MSSRLLQALPALCLAMLVGLAPAMAQTDQGDKAKQQAAEQAKTGCPVSQALTGTTITLDASLA